MMKYNRAEIMRRAWKIKSQDKDYIFGECLKMAWAEAKCKLEKPAYRHVGSLVCNIIYNNAKYFLENGVDKKEYAKNGISYVSISSENYTELMKWYRDECHYIESLLRDYGSESVVYKNELPLFKIIKQSVEVAKEEIA